MSEKLMQLIELFQQLEAWDMQGRKSVSGSQPLFNSAESLPESEAATVETPLSRTVNQYHELTTQIRELAENEQSDDVLNYLAECLQHKLLAVRLQALEALGHTRNSHAVVMLVNTMQHDTDPSVKSAAAQSLGIIGNVLATPALVELLQSELLQSGEIKVRWASAQALSFIADPNAIDALVAAFTRNYGKFEERASDIREAARDALVSIGGEIVVARLMDLWSEPTLHPINSVEEGIRLEMITAFGQIEHPKALEFLLNLAHHENNMVREAVMSSLAYAQDSRVIDVLTQALTDRDSYVRDAAEFSLQRLGRY